LRFLSSWAHLLYIRFICIRIECRKKGRFQWANFGFKVRPRDIQILGICATILGSSSSILIVQAMGPFASLY